MLGSTLITTVIKDCCTVKNGEDYDFAGVAAVLGTIFNCGLAVAGVLYTDKIDLVTMGDLIKNFSWGEAALIAGCAGGKGWKKEAEPEGEPER